MDGLQMGKFAAANKVDHVMLLGDNFVSLVLVLVLVPAASAHVV